MHPFFPHWGLYIFCSVGQILLWDFCLGFLNSFGIIDSLYTIHYIFLTSCGLSSSARRVALHTLLHISELPLLRKETVFLQSLLLLRSGVFRRTHNTSPFVHHQMRLGEFTGGFVRSAVPHLLPGTEKLLEFVAIHVVVSVFVAMRSLHIIH